MSNVIQFLEALGSNPALARLSVADYEAVVASLDAEGAQRQALLDRVTPRSTICWVAARSG